MRGGQLCLNDGFGGLHSLFQRHVSGIEKNGIRGGP